MPSDSEHEPPKKQLETGRGGAGRKGRTAIGSGEGGGSDDFQNLPDEPAELDEPHAAFRPRTVICEGDDLLRQGLKAMIEPIALVIGEARDGMEATEMIRRLRPELVILEVDLDVLNGVEVCRRIRSELPTTGALVWTDSYHATKYFNQLMRAGASGLALKCSGLRILFDGVQAAINQLPSCDPSIQCLVKKSPSTDARKYKLTDQEIDVWIRLDLRNKEIADELDMNSRRVEQHIESILRKTQIPTRTGAALKAIQVGFVLLPKMSQRDTQTGKTDEQLQAEKFAREAIQRRDGKQ